MDLMWLFTVPVLKLAIKVAILLSALFLIVQIIRWAIQATPPNPFMRDVRQPRKPYVHDQKKRDAVLKQGFSMDKVKRLKLCCSITIQYVCAGPQSPGCHHHWVWHRRDDHWCHHGQGGEAGAGAGAARPGGRVLPLIPGQRS